MAPDARRRIPRTDAVLADPRLVAAASRVGAARVKRAVVDAQAGARAGLLAPEAVADAACAALAAPAGLRRVLNATGVVVHTNLGRAPLSDAARAAVQVAAGHVDLEFDLAEGGRGRRGAGAERALLAAVPGAEAALVVNNGAAALVLATTALAQGREVICSRGELVEIGAGFRLPDLIASTGALLREVGTTNRTHLSDYADALGPRTGCVLKVHPSNYRVEGFTSEVGVADLVRLARPPEGAGAEDADHPVVPVVVDLGSGLLAPDPALPGEPDAASALAAGASVVTASGDKLLGGPQAGILLGRRDVIERLRRHPLARALRVDKLALAALEATLTGGDPPVTRSRRLTPEDLRPRTEPLAALVEGAVVPVTGRVGGGGAPGLPLPGLAVALPGHPDAVARALRSGAVPVVARIDGGACLVDLRCIDPRDDDELAALVEAALRVATGEPRQEPA